MSTPARSFFCCGSSGTPPYTRHDDSSACLRVLVHALLDLNAQLARRRQHERARAARAIEQPIDDRQGERGGLAGSCLREAHDVAPLEHERDRLRLDRRRRGVSRVAHRLQTTSRKPELVERRRLEPRPTCSASIVSVTMIPIAAHRGRAPRTIPGPCLSRSAGEQRAHRANPAKLGFACTRDGCGPRMSARRPPWPRPSWRRLRDPAATDDFNLTRCGT